jgi:hypothetical protein
MSLNVSDSNTVDNESLHDAPGNVPEGPGQARPRRKSKRLPKHHPWRRYFARSFVDMFVLGIIPGLLVFVILLGFMPILMEFGTVGLLVLVLLSWLPIESVLLCTVSTTPGKWLFGIYVKDAGGGNLSFGQALSRTGYVMWAGMGLEIPIVGLFTRYYGFKRLMNTGTTLWDAESDSVVVYKEISSLREVTAILLIILVFFLLFLVNLLLGD